MNAHVIRAIFRRNFVSYFSNPTGYVFICVFVLLSGIAAFWPNEFFNANLANLDQLNRYLPYIMLVFIPAITMSMWADERRQGTDELLLTIPASDLDVVLGKYLAAVAIFTVSLLFSISNIVVLSYLGQPDLGLMFGTYFGYWLMGLAMLAIGMVASFLTSNLTVGFILGAAFNAPLAFAASADVIFSPKIAATIKSWSFAEMFRDFGRGVISFSGVAYFLLIVAAMLYLSMVLIGRRHWAGGRDGKSLGGHYLARIVALIVLVLGVNVVLAHHDARLDVTTERLSSLSPKTQAILQELDPKRPIHIEAFVSPEVPESYVQTRLDLLTMLREIAARAGNEITLEIHDTEKYSDNARRAETLYGIRGQQVASRTRGAMNIEEIYLGVAITSGLEKVVVPFFDRGIPVEYELIRSLGTVAQQERKKIGILTTDAKLYGQFDMQRMSPGRNELIIDELEKQYDVVQVNADNPITERFDALLAVQPSTLSPEQMANFLDAVKRGQPTAVFEDPFPYLDQSVAATSQPRSPQGGGGPFGMMGGQQPPQPKGNIRELWNLLGIDFLDSKVVWQNYNPYPKIGQFPTEFVFVGEGSGATEPFNNKDAVSSQLQQMLFLFPGAVNRRNSSELTFTPLVRTGPRTGEVAFNEIIERSFFGGGALNPMRRHLPTAEEYVLAVHIRGKRPEPANMPLQGDGAPPGTTNQAESGPGPAPAADFHEHEVSEAHAHGMDEAAVATPAPEEGDINVVVVADIDVLYSAFFALRNRGTDPDAEVNLDLDNVTFVLNVLDTLAGDDRFIDIRKRRPVHRTLVRVEDATAGARNAADEQRKLFMDEFDKKQKEEQKKLDDRIAELQKRTDLDPQQLLIEIDTARTAGENRLTRATEQMREVRDRDIERIESELASTVRHTQDRYKLAAVLLPPIPPLVVAVVVYFNRRSREREGVSKQRLR
ncbi:MAG: Gldg family protein [Pirellulales bacterium]|nr:Gldg family protein [Pirellulales bacterium]